MVFIYLTEQELLQKNSKKDTDWDELESLLENIDEIGNKEADDDDDDDDNDDPLEKDKIPVEGMQ